jgi:hypothetical protein
MTDFKQRFFRPILMRVFDLLSCELRDVDTGKPIGRAVLLPWRGRILLIGDGVAGYSLLPKFVPQRRLTFWKVELGFTRHPLPDFPHEPRT